MDGWMDGWTVKPNVSQSCGLDRELRAIDGCLVFEPSAEELHYIVCIPIIAQGVFVLYCLTFG